MADKTNPAGMMPPQVPFGEYDRMAFVIQQAMGKMQTATIVRVESCTNSGGLSPVGFVDVTPLINQIDAQGLPIPHTTIHNVPYFRIQGGANGIVIDPEVGDVGICVFASRDISKVKSTKKQANPGSFRQFSFSDGMYIGGILNGTPTQYIQFSASGIKIHSPTSVVLESPDVQILATTVEINASASATVTTPTFTVNGNTTLHGTVSQTGGGSAHFTGSIEVDGSVTADGDVTAEGTSLHNHTHPDPDGGNTGAPN